VIHSYDIVKPSISVFTDGVIEIIQSNVFLTASLLKLFRLVTPNVNLKNLISVA
jgi:hypothetical protein